MRRFLVAATLMLFLLPAFAPHAAASNGKAFVVRVDGQGNDLCYIRTNHHLFEDERVEYWIESNGLTRKVSDANGYGDDYPYLPYGVSLVNPDGVLDPAEGALNDAVGGASGRQPGSETDLQIGSSQLDGDGYAADTLIGTVPNDVWDYICN